MAPWVVHLRRDFRGVGELELISPPPLIKSDVGDGKSKTLMVERCIEMYEIYIVGKKSGHQRKWNYVRAIKYIIETINDDFFLLLFVGIKCINISSQVLAIFGHEINASFWKLSGWVGQKKIVGLFMKSHRFCDIEISLY